MPTVNFYTNGRGDNFNKYFRTYKEVKRKMTEFIEASYDGQVNVYRSRRGEWGEWFEHWEKIGKKKVIVKEGWQ